MQSLVYDEEFRVYSTDFLSEFNTAFIEHTRMCFDKYKALFNVDGLNKIDFHLFDDLEDYRNDYRQRLNREPPEYSRGNFGINSAYIVIDKDMLSNKDYHNKAKAIGAHEGFHIYYRDLVYGDLDRIVWFDEGAAQYFSGEKDTLSLDEFKKYYLSFKKGYKPIKNLNERVQGNSSIPDDKIFSRKGIINGYAISYLAVRYLAETKGEEYLRDLMRNRDQILSHGETIIDEMFEYYDKLLNIDLIPEK